MIRHPATWCGVLLLGLSTGCGPGLRVGTPAPDFTLQALDGSKLSLSQFRGRPVVLTYFASW